MNKRLSQAATSDAIRASIPASILFSMLVMAAAGTAAVAQQGPQGLQPVVPLATCTLLPENRNGELTVVMGYDNPNDEPVSLPLGTQNFFSPSPISRGQPTVFAPGKHTVVFITAFSPDLFSQLEWTLDGTKVTVTADTPRCISGALALSVSGLGSVSAGAGPACADSCVESVDPPLDLPLVATPAPGWSFIGFGGDADCDDGRVTMAGGGLRSCRAEFAPAPRRSIALAPIGPGRIEIDGTGIQCPPGPCIVERAENAALQLHAEAEPGSVFLGWLGDANCLSGAPLLDRDTVCVALFDDDPDLLLLDGFE
jgi:hypothetical protein